MGDIRGGQPADHRWVALQTPTEVSGRLVAPFMRKIPQHGAGRDQCALPSEGHNLSGGDAIDGGHGGEQCSKGDPLWTHGHFAHRRRATIRLLDKAFVLKKPLIHRLIELLLMFSTRLQFVRDRPSRGLALFDD